MIIDSYLPLKLKSIHESIVNQYISELDEVLKPTQNKRLSDAMACLVYNIRHCVATGEGEFVVTLNKSDYNRPIIYNGNVVKGRRVSYSWFKKCLSWMVEKGWVSLYIGSVDSFKYIGGKVIPDKKSSSIVTVSEWLTDVFKPVSSKIHMETLKNVLELRDEEGNALPYRLTDYHYRLIELLDTYNQYLLDTTISIGSSEYIIQGKKVYNKEFTLGGRTYITGVKVMSELLKKENRVNIMIDGKPTVELDFASHHPRIIAEIEGVTLPEDFDNYGIVLDGYDSNCLRKLAKIAMLTLINSKSPRQAAMALSMESCRKLPLDDWKASGLIPDPFSSKRIVQAVMEHNSYALSWFAEGRGLELQNIDSKIMDYIIDKCNQCRIVVIPLHDGVRVGEEYVKTVAGFMESGYVNVLGSKVNCKIKIGG